MICGVEELEISLVEIAGFAFDMTDAADRELLADALDALAELDASEILAA